MLYITHAKFNYFVIGNFHLLMKGTQIPQTHKYREWNRLMVAKSRGREWWKWMKIVKR